MQEANLELTSAEQQHVERLAAELKDYPGGESFGVDLDLIEAMTLHGLIHVALRHPAMDGVGKSLGERLEGMLADWLGARGLPEVRAVVVSDREATEKARRESSKIGPVPRHTYGAMDLPDEVKTHAMEIVRYAADRRSAAITLPFFRDPQRQHLYGFVLVILGSEGADVLTAVQQVLALRAGGGR